MIFDQVPTKPTALSLINHAIESGSFVAMDTETNGEDIRDGRGYLMGISIAYRADDDITSFYLPFNHPDQWNCFDIADFHSGLQRLLDTKQIIFHNARFDIDSLRTVKLDATKSDFYDTMILCHLVDENSLHLQKFSLDSADKILLGGEGKNKNDFMSSLVKQLGWGAIPSMLMAPYASKDTEITYRLAEYILPKAKQEDLGAIWKHKRRVIKVLREMENIGVLIDQDLCNKNIEIGEKRMAEIIDELGGLNPVSHKDLRVLLIDKLKLPFIYNKKTGRPTFDKTAMEKYETILERSNDRTAQLILEYRGWQKSISSNYKAYLNLLSPDGRVRPNYLMHGTRTGRLSCAKPNLQQIPKTSDKPWNGDMKKCFIAKTNFTLIEADYSQLELRLGTAYAQEKSLMEVFEQGRDVFTEMSQELGMSRQDTKTLVYSMQYGGGVNRISEVFGVSKQRATEIREHYFSMYPGFAKQAKLASNIVRAKKKIQLWSGRYRHFRYPDSEAHKAFNSVIQGGAADIVERQMIKLYKEVHGPDCRMLLQVHDSIVFEVRKSKLDYYKAEIERIMTNVEEGLFGVKFAVDIHKWGE